MRDPAKMKKLSRTVDLADGSQVEIEIKRMADGSLRACATLGGECHEVPVTLGAADAPLPDAYDAEQFEHDLAEAAELAARMVHSHARKKSLLAGLKDHPAFVEG